MKILHSSRRFRATTNPYLIQLVDSLPPTCESLSFSWYGAILGSYDVFHIHWPEVLLRGPKGFRRPVRMMLFALVLLRLQVSKVALVRTLHNAKAHEQGGVVERILLLWCDRRTDLWIRLNESTVAPTSRRVVTILHGHYRDWFAQYPVPSTVKGRALAFGLIRPYKGIGRLISEFVKLSDPKVTLRIAGQPLSPRVKDEVISRAEIDARIGLDLRYIPDEDLAREIGEAELVVLPYSTMQNSGALILALSLNRPTLVPAGEVTRAVQIECGSEWVRTFSGDLDVDDLSSAMEWASSTRSTAAPDLSSREWGLIGSQHADAYGLAIQARRREVRID